MEIDDLFDDPVCRRWWLLNKALESAPLAEALKWAWTVEDFLRAPCDADPSLAYSYSHQSPRWRDATAAIAGSGADGTGSRHPPPAGTAEPGAALAGSANHLAGFSSFTDKFAVLASVDGVVRYLRQRDHTIVREGDVYLVDGSVREDIDQLTERANRIRVHDALPPFQLLPIELAPNRQGPRVSRESASV